MGSTGLMFALLVAGYLVGVWTACVVLRQGQDEYEDGARQQPTAVRTRSQAPK
jgi:hypothetical protein